MRILYTAFDVFPAPKGAPVRISQMLQALAAEHEVKACFLGEPGMAVHEYWHGIPLQRLLAPQASFLEKTVLFAEFVLQQVIEQQPDVVHFRSLWDGFPLAHWRKAVRPDLKLVYELHGLPEFELSHHYENLPEPLLDKIRVQQRELIRAADHLICPSQTHLQFLLQQGLSAEQMQVIPNGVDTELFYRHEPVEPAAVPIVIYSGTLAPWQGLEGLLEALTHVDAPFQAWLVGKGQPRWVQDLLARAFQLRLSHLIELIEPLPHALMPRLLSQAQIAVAPLDQSDRNQVQGCNPLKIYEYLACGLPVVAPDLPVVREILTDGRDSLLYPAGELDVLGLHIQRLLQEPDLAQTLGQRGLEKVLANDRWSLRHQALQQFYAGLKLSSGTQVALQRSVE